MHISRKALKGVHLQIRGFQASQYQDHQCIKSTHDYSKVSVWSLIPASFPRKQEIKCCYHFYVDTILEDVPSTLLLL